MKPLECSGSDHEPEVNRVAFRPAIVLVEPTGDRNVGSVARVMKNFGFSDLRLVNPLCDHLSMESKRMAMRADDVLAAARTYPTLEHAIRGCRRVVATTARNRQGYQQLQMPEYVLGACVRDREPVALVFGSEEAGLTNEHLDLADLWLTFPTVGVARSLNLAQCVGISCYEFHRLSLAAPVVPHESSSERPILHEQFQSLLADAERFLWKVNFLQVHTRHAKMRRLTHLLRRSGLSEADGRLLKALFHFIALGRDNTKA